MESQPQNPEFRNNLENFHPCSIDRFLNFAFKNRKQKVLHIGIHDEGGGLVGVSFHTSGDFCRLLISFANSLDPDQA